MRILFLSDLETRGGSSIAATRLAMGLLGQGIEVLRLFALRGDEPIGEAREWERRYGGLPRVWEVGLHGARRVVPWAGELEKRLAGRWLMAELRKQRFDILHVHAIHNSPWNHRALSHLPPDLPTVWTFHDHWGFSPESYRFQDGDGHWVRLKPDGRDRAQAMKRRLAYFLRQRRLRLVANSAATEVYARESLKLPVETIRYGLPLDDYRPIDRPSARAALDLPTEAQVILFSADNLRDPVKGFRTLERAWRSFAGAGAILLLVGSATQGQDLVAGLPGVRRLGRLDNSWSQRLAYSAADLTVMPSLAEALGQVAMESIACGTPVLASEVGGLPEIVLPRITGWLVKPGDGEALAGQLRSIFEEPGEARRLRATCRTHAESHFGLEVQATRYIETYRSLLHS